METRIKFSQRRKARKERLKDVVFGSPCGLCALARFISKPIGKDVSLAKTQRPQRKIKR